jgi:alkyl sulfatase BDS1-like metallo-beta-lactamase superfamily hydrolase
LLLPAHGLPIAGKARIAGVLDNIATALEVLVEQTVAMMNNGARLDEIVHSVKVPAHLMDKPYLKPVYDEPEFIIHNIWRLYGGWYDGNPANLKPAADAVIAAEMAKLAGGAKALAKRGAELVAAGDLRLACHLAEMAGLAAPDDIEVHGLRAEVYAARRKAEASLMSKGIYGFAERQSLQVVGAHNQKASS